MSTSSRAPHSATAPSCREATPDRGARARTVWRIVGWLVAVLVLPVLSALNPIQTITFATYLRDLRLDGRVLAFTSAVSLLTAVLAGLVPALRAARARDLIGVMRTREQHSGGTVVGRRVLGALVVGELALAVTLLAGGGLLVHSFLRLQQVDLGFRPAQLLTLQTAISSTRYPDPAASRRRQSDRRNGAGLPGVVSAGTTTNLPLNMGSWDSSFEVEGVQPSIPPQSDYGPSASSRPIPGSHVGVTLVRGRLLTAADNRLDAQPVVVVSENSRGRRGATRIRSANACVCGEAVIRRTLADSGGRRPERQGGPLQLPRRPRCVSTPTRSTISTPPSASSSRLPASRATSPLPCVAPSGRSCRINRWRES